MIHGFSIITANYHTGQSTAFFTGDEKIKSWEGLNKLSIRSEIRAEHIMASSAIPIFFPPIQIGECFFGDGMVRLSSPLSPAIHMGASRLLVIGIRGPSGLLQNKKGPSGAISLGEVAGTILNGLFFDSLDSDIARLKKVNRRILAHGPESLQGEQNPEKHIPLLALHPSEVVSLSNSCKFSRLAFALAFALKGLGISENRGSDLLSYLSFEPKYMTTLIGVRLRRYHAKKRRDTRFF